MNDLVAWGLMAGMAGYGFLIIGVVRLVERRRTRLAGTQRPDAQLLEPDTSRPGVARPVVPVGSAG